MSYQQFLPLTDKEVWLIQYPDCLQGNQVEPDELPLFSPQKRIIISGGGIIG